MSPRSFRLPRSRTAPALFLIFLYSLLPKAVPPTVAQTTQPFLFAGTYDSNTKSSGLVTLLRNATTGVLSLLPDTAVTFKDPCNPSTIDPTGRFLFGVCAEGVAMYTLDSTTGIAAETSASPYSASVSTGQNSMLVTAESTGQYVYLLKVGTTESPVPSTFTLDTFQIDSTTPALVPINSQSLSFNATWVDSVADPAHHGMFIYANQEQGGTSPAALLFCIAVATALSVVLAFSGIGCGGGGNGGGGGSTQAPPPPQTVATPVIQPASGTFGAAQSVTITDATVGSTIYYTTDGSTPTNASAVYGAAFSVNSAATVQAMASASGYTDSSVSTAILKFRTPAATYPITVNVTATATGSSKPLQLSPVVLTLIVN